MAPAVTYVHLLQLQRLNLKSETAMVSIGLCLAFSHETIGFVSCPGRGPIGYQASAFPFAVRGLNL